MTIKSVLPIINELYIGSTKMSIEKSAKTNFPDNSKRFFRMFVGVVEGRMIKAHNESCIFKIIFIVFTSYVNEINGVFKE